MYADLSSYVCTFEHCIHPPFESRTQWFDHEMDFHRREWNCLFCDEQWKTPKEVENHIMQQHNSEIGKGTLSAAIEAASQPIRQISTSACPLCDYKYELSRSQKASSDEGNGFISLEKFRNHLGYHLEQLALSALPEHCFDQTLEDEGIGDDYPFSLSEFEVPNIYEQSPTINSEDINDFWPQPLPINRYATDFE